METSHQRYEERFKEGYGLMYPDGHVIRIYEKFVKTKFSPIDGKKLLDFGCWNGTHSYYFKEKGFDVYGADIVEAAVNIAKDKIPTAANNFHTITDETALYDLFSQGSFDIVFSNQVLYFLNNDTFFKRLHEFDALLKPGGWIIATMMSRRNYFAQNSVNVLPNGLEEIDLSETLGGNHYVRFIEGERHLLQQFCLFKKVMVGEYDIVFNGLSGHHYIFVGEKL